MVEVTYYFDGRGSAAYPWQDSAYMIDGLLGNFAYTSDNNYSEHLDENNCPGTDLGTITKVELRCYGYGDGDDRITLTTTFIGGEGDPHVLVMPGSQGWSSYADVTNDTNAPSPWTWSAVRDSLKLNPANNFAGVQFSKSGKGNTMYCAKVEIRVTYTPYAPPTVTTPALGNILKTKALGHGNMTATGGKAVTKRGVCWNTTGNPDVNDNISEESPGPFGTGAFLRQMTGLSAGQHYYVKAYAYNSEGYGYGSQVEFDTLPVDCEVLFPNAAGDETNIESQYPDSGSHWEKVDEELSDEFDTRVINSGSTYQRDLYNLPPLLGSGSISKIVVYVRCLQANGGGPA